jgi:hypothetical protein
MVFIFAAWPSAFWMSQLTLYWVQAALRAVGSAVTQRGEDVVSGRMMPTLAPLPSIVPPPEGALLAAESEVAGAEVGGAEVAEVAEVVLVAVVLLPLLLLPLELHAVSAMSALPTAAMVTVVLRMRRSPFPVPVDPARTLVGELMSVECCAREHIAQ